jgi:hypothetical protein
LFTARKIDIIKYNREHVMFAYTFLSGPVSNTEIEQNAPETRDCCCPLGGRSVVFPASLAVNESVSGNVVAGGFSRV